MLLLRKSFNALFGLFFISLVAQITFVLLFQYSYYDSISGNVQYLKQNGLAEFFAFSKSAIDPLLERFDYTMDIWIVGNIFLFFTAVLAGITDPPPNNKRYLVKW